MGDTIFKDQGFLASLDPRVRVASLMVIASLMAVITKLLWAMGSLIFGLFLLLLARPNLKLTLKRFFGVNFFLVLLFLFTIFSTPGKPVFSMGFLSASEPGLNLSLLIIFKANALLATFLALMWKLELSRLAQGLQGLKVPANFIFLLIFTSRILNLLQREWQTLLRAAKLRGFEPKTNLHTYKTLATLLGILLLKSLDQAKRSYEALLLRGFAGKFLAPYPLKLKTLDYLWLLFLFILALLALLALI
ncbi:MAG: energy-coupling factor transporter transmembrane protein EcfT [Desulfovibrionaceae bacterium]|nr:energy-coupling factor transporter transmembrane protein EcfT [Desulfovibrionaceae bacterium]